MRIAVLSDIHGNILALNAVLADLQAQGGADFVAIAGDLCLDGPRPREVLERVRALGCPVVQGNTDYGLGLPPEETATSDLAELHEWARAQIGPDGVEYLRTLPFSHRIPEPSGDGVVLIVHANPQNFNDHLRPLASEEQIAPLLAEVPPEVTTIVFGHLHIPYVRRVGRLLLADIASVGLPKDGDRRAGYGLLTWVDGSWSVEQRRVEYPVEEVIGQLREANPPGVDDLVKMLLRARYPNMTAARGGRATTRRAPTARTTKAEEPVETAPVAVVTAADEPFVAAAVAATDVPDVVSGEPVAVVQEVAEPMREETPAPEVTQVDELTGEEIEPVAVDAVAEAPAPEAEAVPETAEEAPATLASLAAEVEGLLGDLDQAALVATEEASPEERAELSSVMGEIDALIAEMDTTIAQADGAESEAVEVAAAIASDDDESDEDEAEEDEAEPPAAAAARAAKKERKAARRAAKARLHVGMVADEPFSAAIQAILNARLDTVLSFIPGVRADEDPEAVHDMRVASRRLRAALDAAEPSYNKKDFRRALRRVKDLAGTLGFVRDADVLLEFFRERRAAAPREERAGIDGLMDGINANRAEARDDLDPVLDRWGEEGGDYAADFRRFTAKVVVRKGKVRARDLVGAVAARTILSRLDEFEECSAVFDDPEGGDAVAFHDLRIAAKKLRYMIELFTPVLGDEAGELLGELRTLQDTLGTLHDRDVLTDLLAQERATALERQLHMLEFTTFNPGTRAERLAAVRDYLKAPNSFAKTAVGVYGLLIDATDDRNALEDELRARWANLERDGFRDRVRALAAGATARPADSAGAEEEDEG